MDKSHSRRPLYIYAAGFLGGIMFIVSVPLSFLEHAHHLDYLHEHAPGIYDFLLSIQNVVILEFVGLGLLSFVLLELWRARQHKSQDKPLTAPAPSASPVLPLNINVSQIASPNIPITNTAAAVAKKKKEIPATPRLELLEPLHNIFIGETREWASQWIVAMQGPHAGLIADFRNPAGEIGKKGTICEWVAARLVYITRQGQRVSINSGCWLNHSINRICFEPG